MLHGQGTVYKFVGSYGSPLTRMQSWLRFQTVGHKKSYTSGKVIQKKNFSIAVQHNKHLFWFPCTRSTANKDFLEAKLQIPSIECCVQVGFLTKQGASFDFDAGKRLQSMADLKKWTCSACTFLNIGGDSCAVCGTFADGINVEANPADQEWECSACTYINKADNKNCEICLTERAQPQGTHGTASFSSALLADEGRRRGGMAHAAEERVTSDLEEAGTADEPVDLSSPSRVGIAEDGAPLGFHGSTSQLIGQSNPSATSDHKLTDRNSGSASFNQWLSKGMKRSSSMATDVDSGAPTGKRQLVPPSVGDVTREQANSHKATKQETAQDEDKAKSVLPTNMLLSNLHAERVARMAKAGGLSGHDQADTGSKKPEMSSAKAAVQVSRRGKMAAASEAANKDDVEKIIILTYNVWFREDLEVERRMAAIGDIIEEHMPHVICLQEVTPNIYKLLQQQSVWWSKYKCSLTPQEASARPYFTMQLTRIRVKKWHAQPFLESQMGRELCVAALEAGNRRSLMVATSHLESPCPAPPRWDQMFSKERVAQAREALQGLNNARNVVFCGDMNWDDKLDGPMPLPPGWSDAWQSLRPGQPGLTYDCKANKMLEGGRLQKRLDRVFCKFEDFELEDIEMVGTKAIPGLTYQKERKVKGQPQLFTLPVLPSDHFGLLFRIKAMQLA